MAGLLSGLGGIDPNLFNKPTMGQLKNKQQSPAVPAKSASSAPRSDTIAAVGSPSRPDAAPDSFSSQKSTNTRANPERSGRQHRLSTQTADVRLHPSMAHHCHEHDFPRAVCNSEQDEHGCVFLQELLQTTWTPFSLLLSHQQHQARPTLTPHPQSTWRLLLLA